MKKGFNKAIDVIIDSLATFKDIDFYSLDVVEKEVNSTIFHSDRKSFDLLEKGSIELSVIVSGKLGKLLLSFPLEKHTKSILYSFVCKIANTGTPIKANEIDVFKRPVLDSGLASSDFSIENIEEDHEDISNLNNFNSRSLFEIYREQRYYCDSSGRVNYYAKYLSRVKVDIDLSDKIPFNDLLKFETESISRRTSNMVLRRTLWSPKAAYPASRSKTVCLS